MHNQQLNAISGRFRQFVQGENAAVTYEINWAALLDGNDITASIWSSVSGNLTIANETWSTTRTAARLSGDVGKDRAINKITTNNGDVFERFIDVIIPANDTDSAGFSTGDIW